MRNQKNASRLSTHTKRLNEIVSLRVLVFATDTKCRKKRNDLIVKLKPLVTKQLQYEARLDK